MLEGLSNVGLPGRVPTGIGYTTAQQILAIYRACQDGRGAIRSIIKYETVGWGHDANNVNYPWHIDINKIFVGGVSAGSVIVCISWRFASDRALNHNLKVHAQYPALFLFHVGYNFHT